MLPGLDAHPLYREFRRLFRRDAAGLRGTLGLGTDGTVSYRNRLHNGDFRVNQRVVSGTVTLAAGVYGHDRWKAGAGGCTYTFAASGSGNIITISAGSLLQVVEGLNVEGGTYSLANRGTAQARIAVSGAATSGSYAAATSSSPLQSATATGGQTMSVEFTTGTVDRAQLEAGTSASAFERRPYGVELNLCTRYAQLLQGSWSGLANGTTTGEFNAALLGPLRVAPGSITNISNGTWVNGLGAAAITGAALANGYAAGALRVSFTTAAGLTAGNAVTVVGQSILVSADL